MAAQVVIMYKCQHIHVDCKSRVRRQKRYQHIKMTANLVHAAKHAELVSACSISVRNLIQRAVDTLHHYNKGLHQMHKISTSLGGLTYHARSNAQAASA